MSLSGNIAMGILRLVKPGKGSFSDVDRCRERARKENEGFRLSYPRSRRARYELLAGMEKPCLVITPRRECDPERAVLYIYGGVTNNWNTQKGMAAAYAADAGVTVWYPVYPSITETCVTGAIHCLLGAYRSMLERYNAGKIALVGVSMGGFYALQMVNAINHEGLDLPMPGLIVAHSPGGTPETEVEWEELRRYEERDPLFAESDMRMVVRLMPCEGKLPLWALSPARGDYRNAPPTYLYYGEEMLAGNAPLYRRAFERSGAGERLRVTVEKNMMHCYSCMPVFPESKRAYRETIELVRGL